MTIDSPNVTTSDGSGSRPLTRLSTAYCTAYPAPNAITIRSGTAAHKGTCAQLVSANSTNTSSTMKSPCAVFVRRITPNTSDWPIAKSA